MGAPRILCITTGGTMSMVRDVRDGTLAPCGDPHRMLALVPEIPSLAEVDVLELANVDSASVEPELWLELSKAVHERLDDYEGVVVTHGTDTLAYTAAALSFMLQELGKPVVVTGAQVPLEDVGSDGRVNLVNAFRLAAADLAEVAVVFGPLVIRGTRARKTSAFDLQAFRSVNEAALGTIGLSLKLASFARRRGRRRPLLRPFLEPRVAVLPVYPGLKPEVVSYLTSTHAGLLLEGYGAGHIPTGALSLAPAIRAATGRGVPVTICTQCAFGATDLDLYQVGKAARAAGAIPALDMTPETALVKLMWVLGQATDLASVESMMKRSFVGEVQEIG